MNKPKFSIEEFAKQVNARSYAIPSPARHTRSIYDKADVEHVWKLYGPPGWAPHTKPDFNDDAANAAYAKEYRQRMRA